MVIRHFGQLISVSKCCTALFRTYTREQVKLKFPASARKSKPSTSTSRSLPFVVESYLAATADFSDKNNDHELNSPGFSEGTGVASTTPAESDALNSEMQLLGHSDPVESVCIEDDDALRPLSFHCSGCGSPLHCRSAEDPGFITRDKYLALQSESKHKLLRRGYALNRAPAVCHRCTLLIKHQRPRVVHLLLRSSSPPSLGMR
ncbi:unnamed protein product [Dicrocoelium dendriticum]|nr:unnamed protein product [Dicrocoelium dendriticum]